jgi:hypothetical protein
MDMLIIQGRKDFLYAPFVALYYCTVAEVSDSQRFDAGITECNDIGVLVCCILLLARARAHGGVEDSSPRAIPVLQSA